VDGNGIRLNTCRQPGDSSTNFASACLNDDISGSPHITDSALDLKVPGATNAPTTFYAHVLDWRGDARPDMLYVLNVNGLVEPMSIQTTSLAAAARGLSYSQVLSALNAAAPVSWSLTSGNLPPGLFLDHTGTITGTATADGTYTFNLQATDSANPPQVVTATESIRVVERVKITSSPNFPDACVNQPYSYTLTVSGGATPFIWTFFSSNWVAINLDPNTGIFSGIPNVTGTFAGSLGVNDATTYFDSQNVSLTVKNCP